MTIVTAMGHEVEARVCHECINATRVSLTAWGAHQVWHERQRAIFATLKVSRRRSGRTYGPSSQYMGSTIETDVNIPMRRRGAS